MRRQREVEEKSKIYDALCRESSKSFFLEKCPTVIPTLKLVAATVVTPFHLPIYERSLSYLLTRRFTAPARTTNHRLHRRFSKTKTKILVTYAIFRSPFSGIACGVATGFRDNRARKKKKKGKEGDIARE